MNIGEDLFQRILRSCPDRLTTILDDPLLHPPGFLLEEGVGMVVGGQLLPND